MSWGSHFQLTAVVDGVVFGCELVHVVADGVAGVVGRLHDLTDLAEAPAGDLHQHGVALLAWRDGAGGVGDPLADGVEVGPSGGDDVGGRVHLGTEFAVEFGESGQVLAVLGVRRAIGIGGAACPRVARRCGLDVGAGLVEFGAGVDLRAALRSALAEGVAGVVPRRIEAVQHAHSSPILADQSLRQVCTGPDTATAPTSRATAPTSSAHLRRPPRSRGVTPPKGREFVCLPHRDSAGQPGSAGRVGNAERG